MHTQGKVHGQRRTKMMNLTVKATYTENKCQLLSTQ